MLSRDRSLHTRLTAMAAVGAVVILGGCSSAAPHAAPAALSAGCSTGVAAGKLLAGQPPVTMPVPGHPTAVVGSSDGRWAFASVARLISGEIAVIALGHDAPRLVRLVSLPGRLIAAYGLAMTHDGRLLLVA